MTFKIGNSAIADSRGVPFMWGTGDTSTLMGTEVAIPNPQPTPSDYFGSACAVASGRLFIGVQGDDDVGSGSGSMYIYTYDGTQVAKVTASDGAGGDQFGCAIKADKGLIAVGASGDNTSRGSAYLFDLSGTQKAKLNPSDPVNYAYFGTDVAIGNGRVVVGAWGRELVLGATDNAGAAYVFNYSGTQLAKLLPSDIAAGDQFGSAVAVGNGRIVVGSPFDDDNGSGSGSVYVYNLDGKQLFKLKPSDGAASDAFGISVAVGSGLIVVGAYNKVNGYVYLFDLEGNQISSFTNLGFYNGDKFGSNVSIGSGRIVVSAPYRDGDSAGSGGILYVYDLGGNLIEKKAATDGTNIYNMGEYALDCKDGIIITSIRDKTVSSNTNAGTAYAWSIPIVYNIFDAADMQTNG